jgi:Mce-associated membrane protein
VTASENDPTAGASSRRLQAARQRVVAATVAATQASAAAEPAWAARAIRRGRAVVVVISGCAALCLVALLAMAVLVVAHREAVGDRARDADVLQDTRSAVNTLLTIDPADPQGFMDGALAVTTGPQRARMENAHAELVEVIAGLRVPSTGQVLSAGIVGDASDDSADVLVVAEGTNPSVLGADPSQSRVVLLVTMKQTEGRWKMDRTQLQ